MEISPPDTPEADPLKGQPEVKVLPPDLAWRLEAACCDTDVDQFMIMDAEELGLHPKKAKEIASLNMARLATTREKFCDHCTVVAECEHSAQVEGSIAFSLRGGISPYDRPEVKPGRPMSDGIFKINKEIEDDREYARKLRGEALTSNVGRAARQRLDKERSQQPEDAFWEAHTTPSGNSYNETPAGSGWALSQDLTGSVVMVLYRSKGGMLRTRFVAAKHTSYDDLGTPRVLVEGYPDGVNLPNEPHGFWKNHNASSKAGLASPPRVWLD